MKRIKQLSKNLINQIAAGEVIERPASVVKELVENSVDAGATRIEVEISNECRNIRVADNGGGIHKDDLELAFSKHATSKILEEKDLWNISTMGFRGEALASIISVSKVVCTTRTKGSPTGFRLECENSEVKITETGCAEGTIMEVKNLFYNTPVRLKFLRKTQTELASITEIMQGIAISHPDVAFTLVHKGHTSLKTTGTNDIRTVISEVYSKNLITELAEISKEDVPSNLQISGFASNPDFTRSNKKAVYTFVNKRTVKCPILLKAIDTVYRDLIPSGRYPFVVLNLEIPPNEVDVNVHPSKKEIRYTTPNQIYGFVYAAVKEALKVNEPVYTPAFQKDNNDFTSESFEKDFLIEEKAQNTSQNLYTPPIFKEYEVEDTPKIKSELDFYKPVEQVKFDLKTVTPVNNVEKPKIIGQLFNTYILIEKPEGLQIIDQHIAHERYLYEKLKKQTFCASQLLFMSEVIELEPSEISLLEENKDLLKKHGYEIQAVNEKEVIFKQIPQILTGKSPETIINQLLDALNGQIESIEDELLITTACHAAVKAGEKLSIWQMEELIMNWQSTDYPKTCPHGRPVSKIIEEKEVAKFFSRNVI